MAKSPWYWICCECKKKYDFTFVKTTEQIISQYSFDMYYWGDGKKDWTSYKDFRRMIRMLIKYKYITGIFTDWKKKIDKTIPKYTQEELIMNMAKGKKHPWKYINLKEEYRFSKEKIRTLGFPSLSFHRCPNCGVIPENHVGATEPIESIENFYSRNG